MRRMYKLGALGLVSAGAVSLLFSLHTVHVQNRSVGSRLSEMAVKIAHMWPDRIDENYIEKAIKQNNKEYAIPNDIIIDSKLQSSYKEGMKIFKITPEEKKSHKAVLYIHGGGYINQPSLFHWWFLDKLVQETGLEFFIPVYPKTPEFTYEKSYDLIMKLYKELSDSGYEKIILMGDSAGGGLALGFAQMLRGENVKQPGEIILISPWLDISLNHKDIKKYEQVDPMLNVDNLKKIGRMWAGDTDLKSYKISPMHGNLEGLGRISVFVGTREICYPDAKEFSEMLKEKGIDHNYFEYHMMNHNFPLYPIKEGTTSRAQIAEIIR
ncbi:alpha/beta hydrolase [Salinicoccus sp. HZC-1]|uniref:alpha/beta hydrolase n=1 Tax=Salinicoccus sp. HZC-1 TaxID=3385497 RepID=UPI00398B29B6